MKLDVFLKDQNSYYLVKATIGPDKIPDFGNNLYYMATYKGKGVMITVSKKSTPQEVAQIMSVGIANLIEDDKGFIEKIFKR